MGNFPRLKTICCLNSEPFLSFEKLKHNYFQGFINKDAPGTHFPPEEANYTIGTSTFVYEKTEHQKRHERRQRQSQNQSYGLSHAGGGQG